VNPLLGKDVQVSFAILSLAPAQKAQTLDFTITQGGVVSGMAKQLTLLDDLFRRSETFADTIQVIVEFDSITGRRYRTIHEINRNLPAKTVKTSYRRVEEI
jgi:deoxyribose-phosphate aldolase